MVDTTDAALVRPLQFVKVLSWSFLLLILGFNLGLSLFLSNYVETALMDKQKEFGLLLAANLNHQIYTRFTLPSVVGYGKIQLSNPEQAGRLDQVVRSTIHSLNVQEVRMYALDGRVVYSTNKKLIGLKGLANEYVDVAIKDELYSFDLIFNISKFEALFSLTLDPETLLLKTFSPMRSEESLSTTGAKGRLMGVLEFTQDITGEYLKLVNLERMVLGSSLITSIILFVVILTILGRADRLNQERIIEREKLERELMQQEKLAGMGRMVAGVAHEIRNPLGIIRSTAEHLKKKAEKQGGGSDVQLLGAIYDESKRLSRVVTDFLDYARPKQPHKTEVDVSRVVEQVIVFLDNECSKRGVVIESSVPEGISVMGDKDLLYRAFYNVVTNSLQAMEGGGTISISAAREVDVVHLIFMDSGPGFPAEHIEQIKDPFYTTKDTGTGLGLAIVGSILEGHGAQWSLSCGVDGGARVDMIFPEQ
ncbi:MAG: two-component sensor histidine kinase [Proteobacteria bacterium]|nr:two-component sensor histidine kinase [Pseudomonadota bacterium]